MISQKIDYDDIVNRISHHFNQGAKTLNLLGGEPAVNLHGILELLSRIDSGIKIVWNSNMYYNDTVDDLINGIVDIYLADFKCGNKDCAKKLLGTENYIEIIKQNILNAIEHSDVIIRHILIPGHEKCCLEPMLKWIKTEIPDVKISLWDNYLPPIESISAPKEYLKPQEFQNATELAQNMGLKLVK